MVFKLQGSLASDEPFVSLTNEGPVFSSIFVGTMETHAQLNNAAVTLLEHRCHEVATSAFRDVVKEIRQSILDPTAPTSRELLQRVQQASLLPPPGEPTVDVLTGTHLLHQCQNNLDAFWLSTLNTIYAIRFDPGFLESLDTDLLSATVLYNFGVSHEAWVMEKINERNCRRCAGIPPMVEEQVAEHAQARQSLDASLKLYTMADSILEVHQYMDAPRETKRAVLSIRLLILTGMLRSAGENPVTEANLQAVRLSLLRFRDKQSQRSNRRLNANAA